MIPSVLHQFWFTDNAMPIKVKAWRASWSALNTSWEINEWSINRILCLQPKYKIPKSIKFVLEHPGIIYTLKTDVARYFILWLFGGVYADTDMECLRPMDIFLQHKSFAGKSALPDPVGNAVFGTEPGNPIMLDIALAVAKKIICNIDEANRTIVDAGVRIPGKMLQGLEKIYPEHTFYPISWQQHKAGTRFSTYAEDVYCVHHWTSLDQEGWYTKMTAKNTDGTLNKVPVPDASIVRINDPQIIPKKIHRIWLGNKSFPQDAWRFVEEQKQLNQPYIHKLWLGSTVKEHLGFFLPGSRTMLQDDSLNPVVKSDILRYEILRLFGGFYADTDLEIFHNLDQLTNLPFVCADEGMGNVGTAFLGSIPYHPVCRAMLDAIWSNYQKDGPPKTAHQQMYFGGPNLFTKVLKQYPNVVPLPRAYFYQTSDPAVPATIHYFAGCMTKEGWTNKVGVK